jgi:prepilin-type N-terminal cleavage/methylation domain-containing protein
VNTRNKSPRKLKGFTLVELLVGLSLALTVSTAVLSSYLFMAKNLGRSLNQQTLEVEGRRAVSYLIQDVRLSSGVSGTPSASAVTFTIASGATTTTVAYSYDSSTGKLTRTPSGGSAIVLVSNLTELYFRYYDEAGVAYDNGSKPYTTQTTYMAGLKQVSLTFASRTGSALNGTQTPANYFATPRLLLRNRPLL